MDLHTYLTEHESEAAFAKRLKVPAPVLNRWKRGQRDVPAKKCVEIEQLTERRVTRAELRPLDWREIWPELREG